MATVTACTYDAGVARALAFGLPTSRHFLITFNYFVSDTLHTGQFRSRKAVPQGTLFPVAYNPDAPQENDKAGSAPTVRNSVFVVGLVGSIVLSLAWLALLRGCS